MKKAAALIALLLALCFSGCGGHKIKREESSCPPPSYRIAAELFPDEHALTVTTEIEYHAPADDLSAVKFNLYPNAYREGRAVVTEDKKSAAYPHGKESYGGAEVLSVTADIPVTDFSLGEEDLVLTVCIDRRIKRGQAVRFTVEERITLANVKHRLGYSDGYYSLAGFYPEVCPFVGGKFLTYPVTSYGDPFRRESASLSLSLTLPLGYECACSAEEQKRERAGDKETFFYAAHAARDVAVVASQKIRRFSSEICGKKLFYCASDGTDKQKILSWMADAVEYYETQFGAYPYPTYTVVAAPFFEAGVEHAGLAVVSKDLPLHQKKQTILHETAHQWWFGKVGNDEFLHPWLDEGLAEYAVAAFYRDKGFPAVYREMITDAEENFSIRLALKGASGTRFDLPLSELADGYYDRAYSGGLLLFNTLAERFGADRFHAALKTFADRYGGAIVTPDDLIRTLSASLGEDLSPLFNVWLTATVPLQ